MIFLNSESDVPRPRLENMPFGNLKPTVSFLYSTPDIIFTILIIYILIVIEIEWIHVFIIITIITIGTLSINLRYISFIIIKR